MKGKWNQSVMINSEIINRSIDYIIEHLDQEIAVEDVAAYCHFSKFYFSRMFKKETGESIYALIKRLKMEQSAIRLQIEKGKSITEIGLDYGYSSSNYSSAFSLQYQVSPAKFRKMKDQAYLPNPFYRYCSASTLSFEQYDQQIQILERLDTVVIYQRYIGNYIEIGTRWREVISQYQHLIKPNTLLIERAYHDPSLSSLEQCIYDLCIAVNADCPLHNVTKINGGKFAVYRFAGSVQDIYNAFQGMFHIWLANSQYQMDQRYSLAIYQIMDVENWYVEMDLCIPIK